MKKLTYAVLAGSLLASVAVPASAAVTNSSAIPGTAAASGTAASGTSQPQQQGLTFQQAVQLAFNASNTLKNASEDIDRSYEVRQSLGQALDYTPIGVGNGDSDAAARGTFKGITQAQIGWETSKKTYELDQDNITYSVKKAYNAVLTAQKQSKLAQLSLEYEQLQDQITKAKAANNMASDYDVTQEDSKLDNAFKQQKIADQALASAYLTLNNMLGLPKDGHPALADEPQFAPFTVQPQDLETKVNQVTTDSTAVWSAEQNVKIKQLNQDLYTFNTQDSVSNPYQTTEIDITKASNDVNELKKNLEYGVRSTYNGIKQLEDKYQTQLTDLANLEKTLKVATVRYQVGLGIKADVTGAQLAVESKKNDIFGTVVQLDQLKMAYDKPWVASGGSGSGASSSAG